MNALEYALQILTSLPTLITASQSVKDMLADSTGKLKAMIEENRDPTDEEWEELNDEIDQLRRQLHAP